MSFPLRFTVLKERLEEFRGVKPKSIFSLNEAMVMTGASTIATYLIILLQFKTTEGDTQEELMEATFDPCHVINNATAGH